MKQADVIEAISEMARMGAALSAGEAVECIADLVVGLDPARPSYPQEVEALLSVGAHILLAQQG